MANYYNSEWYQNLSDLVEDDYRDWDSYSKREQRKKIRDNVSESALNAAKNPKWTNPYNLTKEQFNMLGVSVNQSAINAADWDKQHLRSEYYDAVPEKDREWFKAIEEKEVQKIKGGTSTKGRDNYFSKDMPGRVEYMRNRLQKRAKHINDGELWERDNYYDLEVFKKAGIEINEDNYNKIGKAREEIDKRRYGKLPTDYKSEGKIEHPGSKSQLQEERITATENLHNNTEKKGREKRSKQIEKARKLSKSKTPFVTEKDLKEKIRQKRRAALNSENEGVDALLEIYEEAQKNYQEKSSSSPVNKRIDGKPSSGGISYEDWNPGKSKDDAVRAMTRSTTPEGAGLLRGGGGTIFPDGTMDTGDNLAPSQVTETKSSPGGDKTPKKHSGWKRAGFIGVGMAVLGAAGLAVNSLMINDKGRLNNAQMYGQQPYSQY